MILGLNCLNLRCMKRCFWVLMVPFMLAQSLSGLFIMTTFYINQEEIAKRYCERRFDAVSSCAASCILTKSLEDNDDREQEQLSSKHKEAQVVVQGRLISLLPIAPSICQQPKGYALYRLPIYSNLCSQSLLRPPIA